MNADTQEEVLSSPSPSSSSQLRAMLLAVFAPFVAIGLLASPLAFDAIRQSLGL
jgi:hypothetical protein